MRKNNTSYCTDKNWTGRADCKHCAIRNTVLFSVLIEAELDDVLLEINNRSVEAGCELFAQGAKARHIYTLRSGCVKMVHDLDNGTSRIVRIHHRGDTIGLEALLDESHRHSAIVLQGANICRIPVGVIHALSIRNPHLYDQLMLRWQASIDEADSVVTDLNTGQAENRLARLLLKLDAHSEHHRIPDLLREDIASIIGVTTETASRLMADFRRRKLISEVENRHMLCDLDALKSLV